MIVMKEPVSLTIIAMKTGKTHFSSHHRNGWLKEEWFIENIDLVGECCHWKIELIGQGLDKKKALQPQKCTFWEKVSGS